MVTMRRTRSGFDFRAFFYERRALSSKLRSRATSIRCRKQPVSTLTPSSHIEKHSSHDHRPKAGREMPERGLEPPPSYLDKNLNLARLPIPPLGL